MRYKDKQQEVIMLGLNIKKTMIRGRFAEDIRNRARRIAQKSLNEKDVQEIAHHEKVMKDVKITWIND